MWTSLRQTCMAPIIIWFPSSVSILSLLRESKFEKKIYCFVLNLIETKTWVTMTLINHPQSLQNAWLYLTIGLLFILGSSLIIHMVFFAEEFAWVAKYTKDTLFVSAVSSRGLSLQKGILIDFKSSPDHRLLLCIRGIYTSNVSLLPIMPSSIPT